MASKKRKDYANYLSSGSGNHNAKIAKPRNALQNLICQKGKQVNQNRLENDAKQNLRACF